MQKSESLSSLLRPIFEPQMQEKVPKTVKIIPRIKSALTSKITQRKEKKKAIATTKEAAIRNKVESLFKIHSFFMSNLLIISICADHIHYT